MRKKQTKPSPEVVKPIEEISFEKLEGHTATLYHYVGLPYQFQLGSVLFEVLEDAQNGYRSSMDKVLVLDTNVPRNKQLLAEVEIVSISQYTLKSENKDVDGYALKDIVDGHIWLAFGTDNADGYYPGFVFSFYPKPSIEDKIIDLIK